MNNALIICKLINSVSILKLMFQTECLTPRCATLRKMLQVYIQLENIKL